MPHLPIDLSACNHLPDPDQDISLLLVSSYLKNPASTFGHVLVKTQPNQSNHSNQSASSISPRPDAASQQTSQPVKALSSDDLLTDSYNFGARIPPNENGVLYALKGLFGFYDAGFARAEFYTQDAVYSKNEQRDMWEYVLNLDEFHTRLLNYHLIEAQSARFTYYFIKQNCGYRSGEILELVSDIETTNRLGGWYAPDFVFDQLVEYDQRPEEHLIRSVHYLPSEQTQLRQRFVQLPSDLQTRINGFIQTEDAATLQNLAQAQEALALDFLIAHRNYKLSQADEKDKAHHEAIKKQLVSRRITLPAGNQLTKLPIADKPSPALSNKTSKTYATVSDDAVGLGMSMFSKDPLNTYTDINKRFEAIKLAAHYDYDDKLEFDEFVLLDMQQVENIAEPLADEPWMSWQLKTGVEKDPVYAEHHSAYGQAGLGVGWQLNPNLLGYGFVNAHLHDQSEHIDGSLELGLRAKRQQQAAELSYVARKRGGADWMQTTQMTLRQGLDKNNDVRVTLSYTDNNNLNEDSAKNDNDSHDTDVELAWHHYW